MVEFILLKWYNILSGFIKLWGVSMDEDGNEFINEAMANTRRNFEQTCLILNNIGYKYQILREDDEKAEYAVNFIIQGEDLPMGFIVEFSAFPENMLIFSPIPVSIPEEKKVEVALAIITANHRRKFGEFDFDIVKGSIMFKLSTCLINNAVTESMFTVLLHLAVQVVDAFNEKFVMLVKDLITIDGFASFAEEH
jgi:hypothetical protein